MDREIKYAIEGPASRAQEQFGLQSADPRRQAVQMDYVFYNSPIAGYSRMHIIVLSPPLHRVGI